MSVGRRDMREPMEKPLLRIEWWVRQAAFGRVVVPDVNWMLTMSSLWSSESGMMSWTPELSFMREVKGVAAENGEVSIRPAALSTKMIFRRDGTDSDCTSGNVRSAAIALSRVTFSRGGLYATFVSAPIIKWAASRCESADMTCRELKAGFKGT